MCRNGEKNITGGEKAIRSKQSLEIDIEREIASARSVGRMLGKGMIKAKDGEEMCWK